MSESAQKPARAHVLIVEDSSVFREMQGLLLRQAGYAVSAHEHPQAALDAAKERAYDLVIIDYELPGMNGQQFMLELRKILPEIAVVFVSGSLTLELAIQLSRQGVAGIFNKPANPKTLLEKINETLSRTGSRDAALPARGSNSPLPAARRGNSNSPFNTATVVVPTEPTGDALAFAPRYFLGRSEVFRDFTHRLWKVRDFRSVLLLQGESGSPFELFARDLAEVSIFRDGPMMVCPAEQFETRRLIEVLAPSLLSHDAGTLVVTGVETFDAAQQKVLETLMTGRDVFLPFARRFRLVLAAAANLSELVEDGRFNETLFYKISSLSLSVPALRDMGGDILINARHLLDQQREATNASAPFSLTAEAAAWLQAQEWPRNYEQLAHTLVAAMRGATGTTIDVHMLELGLRHERDVRSQRKPAPIPAAVANLAASPVHVEETRPPFPLVAEVAPTVAAEASQPVIAPPAQVPDRHAARPAPIVPNPGAHSIFRPASGVYDFSKRLAASLEMAEAALAS